MTLDISIGARRFRDALKAMRSLVGAGYLARLAGGSVRDRLRGAEPKDFDIATSAKPAEVMRHFQAVGWRTVPTGIEHGTVTLVMASGPVEITTLRVDVATDGRHAQVAFGTSFEDDAARRDFTINAMFEDEHGVIFDFHDGQTDLTAGVLRFVGDPSARIREDYLRILRLFRFWSRFGFEPADGTLEAVRAEARGLLKISQERVTSELTMLLAGAHADAALRGLRETGVWALILPEAKATPANGDWPETRFWSELKKGPERRRDTVSLMALLWRGGVDEKNTIERLALRMKMPTVDVRTMAFAPVVVERLQKPFDQTADALDFIDSMEQHGGAEALTLIYAPFIRALGDAKCMTGVAALVLEDERFGSRRHVKLPLDGHRVMSELALNPGPQLGLAMERLKRGFRNGVFTTPADALAWLRKQPP